MRQYKAEKDALLQGSLEGFLADGTHVSTFKVTWTFKQKKSK